MNSRISAARAVQSRHGAAIAGSALVPGLLIALLYAPAFAADPYARGNVTGSMYVGAGRALDRDYTTVGGSLGYMVSEGLMLGGSAETWLGNDPDIYKFTTELRYTFTKVDRVKPYVGGFLGYTMYDGLPDKNSYGARGCVAIPFSTNAAMSFGLVYEKIASCDSRTYSDCSVVYPEAGVMFSFWPLPGRNAGRRETRGPASIAGLHSKGALRRPLSFREPTLQRPSDTVPSVAAQGRTADDHMRPKLSLAFFAFASKLLAKADISFMPWKQYVSPWRVMLIEQSV